MTPATRAGLQVLGLIVVCGVLVVFVHSTLSRPWTDILVWGLVAGALVARWWRTRHREQRDPSGTDAAPRA
jgi:Flp pilus assembly protein TadB